MTIQDQITALEQRRAEIYATASGRWLTAAEQEQLRQIAHALDLAWQLRRLDQAQRSHVDHELTVVQQFRRGSLGRGRPACLPKESR